MRHLLPIIIVLLLGFGGCYDSHKESPSGEFAEIGNCNIAQLKQLCKNGPYTVTSETIFVGRITSSDREGNFYRSMVAESAVGGVEVLLGIYDIASQYPTGLEVAIDMQGCAVMLDRGVLQVGLPPRSYDSTPREFESQAIIDSHIKRSNSVVEINPLGCDITLLDTSLCGRFVSVDNLHPSPIDGYKEENYSRFADNNGNAIFLYISQYADFYDIETEQNSYTIQGILYFENLGKNIGWQYVIKPSSKDDITVTNSTI